LTVFQIQDAENDLLTRTAALCSFISALMSLSFRIVYIVRFNNMRSMYRASRWAEVCSHLLNSKFPLTSCSTGMRNGHILERLLMLPSVWLACSVLTFIVAILFFVWFRGASGETHVSLSACEELGSQTSITCQVAPGLAYFLLVIRPFKNYREVGHKRMSCSNWQT
jgi:cytochrome bd-type quinol oxidase subunit 2